MNQELKFHQWLQNQLFSYQLKHGMKISNKKFAELLGVSATVFSLWLNGKILPSIKTASKMEELFDTSEVFNVLGIDRYAIEKKELIQNWDKLSDEALKKIFTIVHSEIP